MYAEEGTQIQQRHLGHLVGAFTVESASRARSSSSGPTTPTPSASAAGPSCRPIPRGEDFLARLQPLLHTQRNRILLPTPFSPRAMSAPEGRVAIVTLTRALAKEPGLTMSAGVQEHPEGSTRRATCRCPRARSSATSSPRTSSGPSSFSAVPGSTFITGQTMVIDGGQYFHRGSRSSTIPPASTPPARRGRRRPAGRRAPRRPARVGGPALRWALVGGDAPRRRYRRPARREQARLARDDLPRAAGRARDPQRRPDPRRPAAIHGADLAFGVPGESYLAVLDALYDAPIHFIACRHEARGRQHGRGYGKLTGRPGICLVTRGPGATHAAVGVHTACQDSTPMLLLVGQVARGDVAAARRSRSSTTARCSAASPSGSTQIDETARMPESSRAPSRSRRSGRPGPVVARAARGHAADEADVRRRRALPPVARPRPARRDCARAARAARRGRAAADRSSAAAAGARRRGPTSSRFARGGDARRLRRSAARTTSTTTTAVYAGHAGIGIDPALASAIARGRRAARRRRPARETSRPAATRCSTSPRPRQTPRPRPPRPRGARARSTSPSSASSPALPRSPPPPARSTPTPAREAGAAAPRRAPTYEETCERRRELPGDLQLADVMALAARAPAARRDRHQRRGQLHGLGCTASTAFRRYPTQLAPDQRRDGLRRAGGGRRQGSCIPSAPWCASPATATSS